MNNTKLDILFRKELDNFINEFSVEDLAIKFLEKNDFHLSLERDVIDHFLGNVQSLGLVVVNFDEIETNSETIALSRSNQDLSI